MNTLFYSMLVFVAACSYGSLATIMKLGMKEGYQVGELVASQFIFGFLILVVLTLIFNRKKVAVKSIRQLLIGGVMLSGTSIFYNLAVRELPASISVLLIFQFTWIGILLEAIADRRFPSKEKVFAIAVLIVGTLFAGGLFEESLGSFSTAGIIYGLISAVTFASYIFISGRVGVDVPVFTKSLTMVGTAMLIVFMVFPPTFIGEGTIVGGLWKYGGALALLGTIIPVVFFAVGVPKIGTGLGTILGAAELPAAVVASVIVLQEQVSWLRWIGIIIILLGIMLPQLRFRSQQPSRRKTVSSKV
ncbi:EamA family transporter [Brevibacillus daliensis]|uniref:EamA family transporter n=1 Tax=Brevibacillus daliensis TaxID=2892995 RepID=UPI0035A11912